LLIAALVLLIVAGVVESVISCTLLGPFLLESEPLSLTVVAVDGGIIFLCGVVVWFTEVIPRTGLAGGELSMLTAAIFLAPIGISSLARGAPISPSSNPTTVQ